MSLVCPRCTQVTLDIVESADLGPDAAGYEHAIQRIRCSACELTGGAEYREFGGTFTGPEYDYEGFLFDAAGEDALRLWFSADPRAPIEGVRSLAQPLSSFEMQTAWDHERASRWKR